MKIKLGRDYLPHLIVGAFNSVLADKALFVGQHIGLMLPCNVSIRKLDNEAIEVAISNPFDTNRAISTPLTEEYEAEISEKLNRVLDNIKI